MSKPLKILIISDGKPGHYNQSLGLAEAMQRLHPAEVKIHQVSPLSRGQSLSLLLGLSSLDTYCPEAQNTDFIITAGHRCHLSLWALSRRAGAKSIVMMKPSLPLACFDYCVVPEHDGLKASDKIIVTKGAVNRVVYRGEEKTLNLILLGGPSKHANWDDESVIDQVEKIVQSPADGEPWQLLTSRRTPESFIDSLSGRLPELTLIQPQDVAKDWLAKSLPKAKQCWVSQDSVSMVFESLTASADVGLIQLASKNPGRENKLDLALSSLWGQKDYNQVLPACGEKLDESTRCARLILAQLVSL